MSVDYDLIVIGGGSGGMAAAKEAARHGAKVAMFDFVKPSPRGTTWGLGGTCVNVGCIPKKLMHYSALLGSVFHDDAWKLGWEVNENPKHNWSVMASTIQNYIKSLNFSYRTGLHSASVNYINAHASFKSAHEVQYTLKGVHHVIRGEKILIATGGRPSIPTDVDGAAELAMTSDDIFWLKEDPGKSLVVGASYISLECAGFLTKFGNDTTVAVRSILLRGFDRQCSEKVGEMMRLHGTKFVNSLPSSMKRRGDGRIEVTFADGRVEEFDSVFYAVGRYADTQLLHLENVGVKTTNNGKIITDNEERTNIPHIYAVGDILAGRPELTPVAIRTGELLARRLFGNSQEKMDWSNIPTTVFTPVEYGTVGLSEEAAIEKYGEDDIEVFLYQWSTLEHAAVHRRKHELTRADDYDVDMPAANFTKLVCLRSEGLKVVGFHFVGSNAGEVTQGFALALRLGAKKSDFDSTIGIHPTDAESLTYLSVTKRSGQDWVAAGGCGGGKCG